MGWWEMRGDIPGQRVATHSHFFRRARGSATQRVRILENAGSQANKVIGATAAWMYGDHGGQIVADGLRRLL